MARGVLAIRSGALALLLHAALGCAPPPRPNLVLVSIDTLRADHLSGYGYPRETSPRLDRFAARSLLFEEAYSQSPKTAPSHMTLMTGLYPEAHGVRNWEGPDNEALHESIPTLAMLLKAQGYRSAASVGGGHLRAALGFDRGFDRYEQSGRVEVVFERARRALEGFARPSGDRAPFFLFVHTYAVHAPYLPAAGYRDLFTDPGYTGRIIATREGLSREAGPQALSQYQTFWNRVDPRSPADLQHLQDLYDAAIRQVDDQFGDLLDSIDALGLREDTIVAFLSDHGEEFREHGRFNHDSMYQEVLRVPLVIHFPGERGRALRGQRTPQRVGLVDVLPTLLGYLQLPVPASVQGQSFLPLRSGPGSARALLSQWPDAGQQSLRIGDWKLIRTPAADSVRDELYDVARDPAERRNRRAEAPQVAAQLGAELERWRAELRASRAASRDAPRVDLDEHTREELEALGYLDARGPE